MARLENLDETEPNNLSDETQKLLATNASWSMVVAVIYGIMFGVVVMLFTGASFMGEDDIGFIIGITIGNMVATAAAGLAFFLGLSSFSMQKYLKEGGDKKLENAIKQRSDFWMVITVAMSIIFVLSLGFALIVVANGGDIY